MQGLATNKQRILLQMHIIDIILFYNWLLFIDNNWFITRFATPLPCSNNTEQLIMITAYPIDL